jgi:XTP/dITP diphosphohydrolase
MMSGEKQNMKRILVIATTNLGKLEEIRVLLEGRAVTLARPIDILGRSLDVVEDGETFQANAELKARAVGLATGELTLADDSGLVVDALGGLPGVRSARFAGVGANDRSNNEELLRRLAGHGASPLTARFCCAMALFDPKTQNVEHASGTCEGTITLEPRGTNGFGYDPLFVVTAYGTRTMAELSAAEKNSVSHRARAIAAMVPRLTAFIAG